ncbi:MAG: YezD family protein [bacterium]|nr:YezD family protein [bacterium]
METNKENSYLNKRDEFVFSQILPAIKSLKFGSVEIVIHDSEIVQVNKIERMRFGKENTMKKCK